MEVQSLQGHRRESASVEFAWLATTVLVAVELASVALLAGAGTLDADALAGLTFLSLPLCGAVVVNQQPRNRLGWVFLIAGTAAIAGVNLRDGGLPAFAPSFRSPWVGMVGDLTWPVGFPLLFASVPLLFPAGRTERRWRWAVLVGIVGLSALALAMATEEWDSASHGGPNPLAIANQAIPGLAIPVGLALVAISGVAGLIRLTMLYRSGDGTVRRQIRDLLMLTVVMAVVVVVAAVVGSFVEVPKWVNESLPAIVLLGYPVAITVAVLRHRLFGHSFVLHRSSVVRLSQVGVASLVLGGAALVAGSLDLSEGAAFAIGALGCVAAIGGSVVSGRVVSRRVVRGVAEPDSVFERLPVLDGTDLPLGQWAHLVQESVRSPRVELDVAGAGAEAVGRPLDLPAVEIPLGELGDLGRLVVSQRSAAEPFGAAELALLRGLATLIAAAARHARTAEQAQRAERSLAQVAATERERLHRDLHDQIGPRLAGIGYLLKAVDPSPETESHLESAVDELIAASGDVRRLARDLKPSELERFGPTEAIRRFAFQWAKGSAIDLDIDLDEVDQVSDRVAASLYSVALEAMTNVARHSRAASCTVRLRRDDGRVRLDVIDDGVGGRQQPVPADPGIGLASMRARADELGGRLDVSSCAEGTHVRFEVPADA